MTRWGPLVLVCLACASPAHAQPPAHAPVPPPPVAEGMPVVFAQRPLTLPDELVRVDAFFQGRSAERRFSEGRDSALHFLGVIGLGITDDFEGGIVPLPIQLVPEARYEGFGVYALVRYLRGDVEAGVRLEGQISADQDRSFGQTTVALPFLFRFGESVRLDAEPLFHADHRDEVETRLALPLTLTVQASETFFLGIETGVTVVNAEDGFGEDRPGNAFIPAGLFLGGTLRGATGPRADLHLAWLLPTVTDGTEEWLLSFGGSFYIY